ncbi:hypothetical protein P154DRAFT_435093 [Amniculicola lignicola CBS 123094]|uniref:Uncharacterized protein n=1 Tax=Amniculicola lignicola CBS 123094 TaxID=1392246 RepID=A0A6A5WEP8_9PLEO|nr:hypothetical protein P154DRAFT_435093 [Amniculicola lignicola CBS 123094]
MSLDLKVFALKSGSSLDRIDCALVHYTQHSADSSLHTELLRYHEIPIPPLIRNPFLALLGIGRPPDDDISPAEIYLGKIFSSAVKWFCKTHHFSTNKVDLVSLASETASVSSLRLARVIAAHTSVTTVTDFMISGKRVRTTDDSFTTLIDSIFIQHESKFRICINIGETTHASSLPPNGGHGHGRDAGIRTWDCGPASTVVNTAMLSYTNGISDTDTDGVWGARGNINYGLVKSFLHDNQYPTTPSHKFNDNIPPQDLKAQALIEHCVFVGMNKYDTIATLTRITSQNIINQYRQVLIRCMPQTQHIDEVVLCGRGATNPNILSHLQSELPGTHIKTLEDIGVPTVSKQTITLAYLGLEAILRRSVRISSGEETKIHAKIVPGEGWSAMAEKSAEFGGGSSAVVTKMIVGGKSKEGRQLSDGKWISLESPEASDKISFG